MKTRDGFEIDKTIGANLRRIRKSKSISQVKLGKEINVTYQQIQKYEKGFNKISSSKLFVIANYLKVPFSDFFDMEPEKVEFYAKQRSINIRIKEARSFLKRQIRIIDALKGEKREGKNEQRNI
ncbi:MAG: helix-turn-helix domain-containing protein [Holosporaceae bacterium]|jgi:transcriptional regulator with XRE-family HTH domain|nr:helix-turn-helix domain-containing protein [Holosporaceae bacterium]